MNRALLRLSLACLAMFVLLLLNINYVQAFKATKLAAEPGNIRVFDQQFSYQRGAIMAAGDGTDLKIAESRLIKGTTTYQRYYPQGKVYAPVTGYDTIYSQSGIEQAENSLLAGTSPQLAVHNLTALLTGKQKQGATVELTVSPAAQKAAYDALTADGGHAAAVVAIQPSTGAILALASYPTFNPNDLTTFNGSTLNKVDHRLLTDSTQPLLNRAIQETYPPGSSFKIVTSSAAFSHGLVKNPNTLVNAPEPLRLPNGNDLINDGGEICGDGHPPIIQAFWMSCNTAFGELGMKLTAPTLRQYSSQYGMNRPLSIPLPVVPSVMPKGRYWLDPSLTAFSAMGQFNDAVTPLQEAMFSAAVANHGKLMYPYLVQQVVGPGLSQIQRANTRLLSQAASPTVAGYVQSMMYQVTNNPGGTAYATAGPQATGGITIDGKTGTAQNGLNNGNLNDAVFTCFVPGSNGQPSPIAVGVIVQGGGFGADAAAPIAVQVIKAYLGAHS
ncbi:MAG TPA: penicillin-binding transpeptidase domain-containing protein [Streptosporangiaceae bacterium]|nr:penicillin-binding transpeptidase domain-containing protein [Streptosporangiaceae bacterium]